MENLEFQKKSFKNRIAKIHYGQAALVAAVVPFFYLIALPLQIFLPNAHMFDYSVGELMVEALVLFAGAFVALFAAEILTEPFVGRVVMLAILLAGILGYVQSSILAMGLPPIDGCLSFLRRPSFQQYIGKKVIMLVFVVVLCAYKWLIPYVKWIALGFLVMSVAFVFDGSGGFRSADPEKTKFDEGFCPMYDLAKSVEFSTNRNVFVLIVDSAPADILDQVMETHPDLKASFPGFVAFRNNLGMHDCTLHAMPAMMTGRYLEKETDLARNEANFWGDDSIVSDYASAGYDMYVNNFVGHKYTNRRKSWTNYSVPKAKYAFLRYSNCSPFITLKDVMLYRLWIYRFKISVIREAMARGSELAKVHSFFREWQVYPGLAASGLSTNAAPGVFCLMHTEGLHIPIVKDGKGAALSQPDESREAIGEYAPYVMNFVGDFLKSLRQRGLYDHSMIVIAADHGILYDARSAMLWVKPIRAREAYRVSDAPTSHCRLAELFRKSVREDLSGRQVEALLRQDTRKLRIRQASPEKWWQHGSRVDMYDIIVDGKGNELSRENLGQFKID